MKPKTVGDAFIDQGQYKDTREYQQLKEAAEVERDATRRYYEKVKRQHGHAAAVEALKRKRMNPDLI